MDATTARLIASQISTENDLIPALRRRARDDTAASKTVRPAEVLGNSDASRISRVVQLLKLHKMHYCSPKTEYN
jgi:hypothetical protein